MGSRGVTMELVPFHGPALQVPRAGWPWSWGRRWGQGNESAGLSGRVNGTFRCVGAPVCVLRTGVVTRGHPTGRGMWRAPRWPGRVLQRKCLLWGWEESPAQILAPRAASWASPVLTQH